MGGVDNMSFEFDAKVRVQLPEFLHDIIINDVEFFGINKNRLCNEIFAYYSKQPQLQTDALSLKSSSRTLQFTLNNANQDLFAAICDSLHLNNKAEYFRNILYTYCNQPKYMRERVLFSESLLNIERAISVKRKLKIKYKDGYRVIEPYFLIKSDGETRNYIFCFCQTRQSYCNYRLSNIRAIAVLTHQSFEHNNAQYIQSVKENFDAFLSYGKFVKVRLNNIGQAIYKQSVTHRPKLIAQEGDVFTFECSELKAQLYFPQFMSAAEILEPLELRDWFSSNFNKMIKLYNN